MVSMLSAESFFGILRHTPHPSLLRFPGSVHRYRVARDVGFIRDRLQFPQISDCHRYTAGYFHVHVVLGFLQEGVLE